MLILQAEGVGRAARASLQAQQLISDQLIPNMLSSPTAPPQTTPLDGGPSSITDPVPRHEASLVPPLKANAEYKTASGQSVTHDEGKHSSPDYSTALSSIHPTIPSPSSSSSSSSDSYLKSELVIGQNYDPSLSTSDRLLNKLLNPASPPILSPFQRNITYLAPATAGITSIRNEARKGITATTAPTVPATASAKKSTSRRTSKKKGEKDEVSVTTAGTLEDEIDSISARLRQRLSSTSTGGI